jgi:hypothetical protein
MLVSWIYTHLVGPSVAATENLKKDIMVKTDKFLEHALRFGRALWLLKYGIATIIISGLLFRNYIHSLIPYCDPWRDNSVGVVSSGWVSSILLFPCGLAGASRDSGIANFVQFNHISNVSEALADHKIDYKGLPWLSENANIASDSLARRKWGQKMGRRAHGVQDLEKSLKRVGPLLLDFLRLRQILLDEIKEGLSTYKSHIDSEDSKRGWKKNEDFSLLWGRRGSTIKITFNKELTFISNRTLTAVKANADELYAKLGEGKELFEKIRHYFVLNHYLQKVSSNHRNTRQRYIDLYVRLGGQRFEIEEYANAIYSFKYPDLELAFDDYLLQFRQARKILKNALSAYGKDDEALTYPTFTSSRSETKERLAKEFALQGTKLISLVNGLNEHGNRTEKVVRKVVNVLNGR